VFTFRAVGTKSSIVQLRTQAASMCQKCSQLTLATARLLMLFDIIFLYFCESVYSASFMSLILLLRCWEGNFAEPKIMTLSYTQPEL